MWGSILRSPSRWSRASPSTSASLVSVLSVVAVSAPRQRQHGAGTHQSGGDDLLHATCLSLRLFGSWSGGSELLLEQASGLLEHGSMDSGQRTELGDQRSRSRLCPMTVPVSNQGNRSGSEPCSAGTCSTRPQQRCSRRAIHSSAVRGHHGSRDSGVTVRPACRCPTPVSAPTICGIAFGAGGVAQEDAVCGRREGDQLGQRGDRDELRPRRLPIRDRAGHE